MKKYLTQENLEEFDHGDGGEVFDPGYHEDYFDVDEVDEYGPDDEDRESDYLTRELWDEEGFDDEDESEWLDE